MKLVQSSGLQPKPDLQENLLQELYPGYGAIDAGSQSISGGLVRAQLEPQKVQRTIIYVGTENVPLTVKTAVALGSRIVVPPTNVPGWGSYAHIQDPDQNTIAVFSKSPLL